MTKEKLLQAMAAMVAARDWQGFLHLRRLLRQSLDSGFAGELRNFLNSLPPDIGDKLRKRGNCQGWYLDRSKIVRNSI